MSQYSAAAICSAREAGRVDGPAVLNRYLRVLLTSKDIAELANFLCFLSGPALFMSNEDGQTALQELVARTGMTLELYRVVESAVAGPPALAARTINRYLVAPDVKTPLKVAMLLARMMDLQDRGQAPQLALKNILALCGLRQDSMEALEQAEAADTKEEKARILNGHLRLLATSPDVIGVHFHMFLEQVSVEILDMQDEKGCTVVHDTLASLGE
jgi:hypothetical protein